MFSKFLASSILFLAFLSQVHAHAAIAPQLGVGASPKRSDVKRPNNANPCGAGASISANALDSSTAVTAGADGSVQATAINFNGGADGSRKVTAKVDPTGKGQNFVAMTVTQNGDAAPTSNGPQNIVAQLPAGTKCTGGATGNKCLVQFVTTAGFGNCVVVSQGAGGATGGQGATGSNSTATAAGGAAGAASGGAAGTASGNNKGAGGAVTAGAAAKGANRNAKAAGNRAAATGAASNGGKRKGAGTGAQSGTRAARSLRAELASRENGAIQVVKRAFTQWVRS